MNFKQGYPFQKRGILGDEQCSSIFQPGHRQGAFHTAALAEHTQHHRTLTCEITLQFRAHLRVAVLLEENVVEGVVGESFHLLPQIGRQVLK